MAPSFSEKLSTAGMLLSATTKSTFKYAVHGPRLPGWKLKNQLHRDLFYAFVSSSTPQIFDDSTLDTIDVQAIGAEMQANPLPEKKLTVKQGIYKVVAISAKQVTFETDKFDNIGVGKHDMLSLIKKDAEQDGTGREISCELVVATSAKNKLEKHAAEGNKSLLTCAPVCPGESILLYVHGGGFALGNSAGYRHITCQLSESCAVRVLSVDYRLAPQNPFPSQVYDVLVAYKYLLQQGFAAENITVSGDSAGGTLAIALTHLLRFIGSPVPGALVLLSPWSNLVETKPSVEANKDFDFVVLRPLESPISNPRLLYKPGQRLTPEIRAEMRDPLVSPYFGDFKNFPPTLVQAGSKEVLIDDIEALVKAIDDQNPGNPDSVVFEPATDMYHVFQNFPDYPESVKAYASIGKFVAKWTASQSSPANAE
ncbi:hypothetical protein GGI15_002461 [Coemansia interrupta]|uniref:Alpha/beta hydrolase fold-3 domain-containing protein n=1 Tax=Coemansia interrupta TaxID=1126814 RepID=A0A9W8HKB9_9FUNG|nr:hypothetical protein GGI15_002461 [Coemansia interrupta]